MGKDKRKPEPVATETLPAIVEDDNLPAWFFETDDEVGTYDIGGDVATGDGLPFVSCANPKAGGAGGKTTWADLQKAGCGVGDMYASGGGLEAPVRVAGSSLLLIRCVRVAYICRAENGYKPENTRRIGDVADGAPDEDQALDALVLVLANEPFLATYRERLSEALAHRSTVVGVWAHRLEKAEESKWPKWSRLAARIRSEPKVSKRTGQTYYREILATAPLATSEIERLVAWMKGAGKNSAAVVEAWEDRFREVPREVIHDESDSGSVVS